MPSEVRKSVSQWNFSRLAMGRARLDGTVAVRHVISRVAI